MKQAFNKIGLICTLLVFIPFISSLSLQLNQQQSPKLNVQTKMTSITTDEEIFKPSNWIARGGCWEFSNNIISARGTVGSCKFYYSKADYKDFSLEVKVNKLAETGGLGLLVRYDEQKDEGYIFGILPSSGYWFAKIIGDNDRPALSAAPVPFINNGLNVWNTLKIVCHGAKFDLYLNGDFISSITDGTYISGRIGLIIGGDPRQRASFEIVSFTIL